MNPRKKNPTAIKRKQVFINKSFQARFIVKFCLILVLGGLISIGLTLFNTQDTLTSSFTDSKLVIQNTSLAIMPSVIYTTLITTALVGLVVIMVTLLVSHKIAGPMFRFEKDIDRISKGDLKSRISIRKGDQFKEVATSLNAMIESLNKNLSDIQTDVTALAEKQDLPEALHREIVHLNEKINTRFKL
ncbi:MAG: methyl-accepting chemotaxis protein [Proteobacteria bacterium]|nr:methyl-accepting chemotaxis protein [Desulfobacula sp.]MBU3951071.1 methyl-accepting chemotaxis protein [Pseudomonadota bacterium]MBU4130780.1 methyl-accepting chemotaxis protein [Pseudomonadota bacterium]